MGQRLLILGLLAVASTAAAQPAPSAPTAQLRFAWPVGTEAVVESERERERSGDRTAPPTRLMYSQRMRVLAHAEGRLIQFDQASLPGRPAGAGPAGVAELLQAALPSFVVSGAGQLLRIDNLASIQATARAVIETAVPRDSPMPQPIQDLLARVTSEPVLTQMAGQEWELLVGTWTGLPLAPGRSEASVEQAIPMLPGVKVPMQIAIVVGERAPCPRGGVSRDCVNLEMRSSVDQNGMAPVMAALLKGVDGTTGAAFERFDVVTVVTVRLEAETMLPHDVSMVRTGDVTVRENGKSVSARQVDRRTSRFVYPSK